MSGNNEVAHKYSTIYQLVLLLSSFLRFLDSTHTCTSGLCRLFEIIFSRKVGDIFPGFPGISLGIELVKILSMLLVSSGPLKNGLE